MLRRTMKAIGVVHATLKIASASNCRKSPVARFSAS